jgi:ribosomal protein RSM22 (predicted rRNA methylase)
MSIRYPEKLEQWWLARCGAVTGCADVAAALENIRPDVARLSDLFTTERPRRFEAYAEDGRQHLAYGLFFFPQTFARVRCVMDECRSLEAGWPLAGGAVKIIDLGCGSGAAACAVLSGLPENNPVELEAVDHSPANLRTVSEIVQAQWPAAALKTVAMDMTRWTAPASSRDLILVSFALNEAFDVSDEAGFFKWIRMLLSALTPQGMLVIVEPAGLTSGRRLKQLRDRLAAEGAGRILSPCPHYAPCPLTEADGILCHEVRRWQVPDSVAWLNRKLQRTLHDIKFSFLVVARPDTTLRIGWPGSGCRCRLVAPVSRQKGRLLTAGCFEDGARHNVEMLTRALDRAAETALCALERGERVELLASRLLGDGATLRVEGILPLFGGGG